MTKIENYKYLSEKFKKRGFIFIEIAQKWIGRIFHPIRLLTY